MKRNEERTIGRNQGGVSVSLYTEESK